MLVLASFSIDLTGLMTYAEDMFNALAPALLPVLGITVGIAILMLVMNSIRKAIRF